MAAAQTQLGSKLNVQQLTFVGSDLADASATLTSVNADVNEYVMPYRGSIIGVSMSLNGTLTTGTLTPFATVDGTETDLFENAGTHQFEQYPYQQQESRKTGYTFLAGQRIGFGVQATGTIAPETRDVVLQAVVLLEDVEY